MKNKLIGIIVLAFAFALGASSQQREATERSASKKTRIEIPDTVVRQVGERIVVEEPVGKAETRVKVKRPKDMKYRRTYLEIEFETVPYRKRVASANEADRAGILNELLEKLSKIEHVGKAELSMDSSMVIVTLDDDSEFRGKL